MNQSDIQTSIEEIQEQFAEYDDVDTSEERLREEFEELAAFDVPVDEAERSVRNSLMDEAGITTNEVLGGGNDLVDIEAVGEDIGDDKWLSVEAEVLSEYEGDSDAVAQYGYLGDDTGTIRFVSWEASDLPALEEGETVRLDGVVTDYYDGTWSVKLNSETTIEEIDETFDVPENDDTITVEGAVVAVKDGSGLIKRCPDEDCSRVLNNGRCAEHGEVDGEFDLRIKAVLDDGDTAEEIQFDQEATEELLGTTLAEAKQKAMDALDMTVILDEAREALVGRYLKIEGGRAYGMVFADEFERLDALNPDQALIEARTMAAD